MILSLHRFIGLLVVAFVMLAVSSCKGLHDDNVPAYPVYISFATSAEWDLYGVKAALDTRIFIKSERVPSDYPWTALTETGCGGVLLACDIMGAPVAYDLSCPVEASPKVRLSVDRQELVAKCAKCGSTYDIFQNYGYPLSGPAVKDRLALQRYHVQYGASGGVTVTR